MTASSILVLGAGELGMAVLQELAVLAAPRNARIAVLLRPASLQSATAQKLRELGIELIPGDLQNDSQSTLSALFAPFASVICCTGFAAGPGTQRKLAQAAIEGGVQRYVPWQFGVDYDVIGPVERAVGRVHPAVHRTNPAGCHGRSRRSPRQIATAHNVARRPVEVTKIGRASCRERV